MQIEFSEPSLNASGGCSVYVKEDGKKIMWKTPKSKILVGIEEMKRNSIHICIKDLEFERRIIEFNDCIITTACNNCKKWFGKHVTKDIIKSLYNNQCNVMRAKMTKNVDVYNEHGKLVDHTTLKKDRKVELIVECVGLYFIPKEFGISWKILQARVYPNDNIETYSFESDCDDMSDAEPV